MHVRQTTIRQTWIILHLNEKTMYIRTFLFQTISIEVGSNGREMYGQKVDKLMFNVGYTKVVNLCCGDHPLDNIYVRNDFRSAIFDGDWKPKILRNSIVRKLRRTKKKYIHFI